MNRPFWEKKRGVMWFVVKAVVLGWLFMQVKQWSVEAESGERGWSVRLRVWLGPRRRRARHSSSA